MTKNEIHEKRMKEYFIQATKELLKGEGLKVVSVRNVAEQAGYSYATMYNYFKDIKELVFICVKDFMEECRQIVETECAEVPSGKEKIRAVFKSYIKYFIQYPGIFELFFLENMYDLGAKQPTSKMIFSFPDELCEKEWDYCISQNIYTKEETEQLKQDLKFAVTGMLLFYLNRRIPEDYNSFTKMVDGKLKQALNTND